MPAIAAIRKDLERFAAAFEPSVVSADGCSQVIDDVVVIEKLAGTIKALASARVAETELWRKKGDRSPAHDLARRSGTSVRDAQEAIAAGKQLGKVPALDEAARKGELSTSQAAAIADAVGSSGNADTAKRLVKKAKSSSLGELRDECLRTKAAGRDAEENHRRIKAARRVRTWTDGEGGWNLSMRDTPEAGAEIMSVLDKLRDRIFRAASREGRSEPSEAYAADAMLEMARRAAGRSAAEAADARPVHGTKVIVRIDWDALLRGYPIDGEVSEVAGIGPVPVSLVRSMIDSGDAFLAAVVTKGHDVLNVAHLGRRANVFQQTALDWLQPTCTTEGCNAVAQLQIDHRHDWADTKITLLAWLDRLCKHHHDRKTRDGWMLVDGHGKRPMVPPDDPRHPNRARAGPKQSRAA
jgi:hypothetical protein